MVVLSRPDPDRRGGRPYHPTVRRIDFIAYLVGLALGAAILIASGYADRSPAAVRQGDFAQFWVGPRAFILGMDPYARATWHTTAVSLGAVTTDTSVFGYFGWSLVLLYPLALVGRRRAAVAPRRGASRRRRHADVARRRHAARGRRARAQS